MTEDAPVQHPLDVEDARRSEIALLVAVQEQVLREAGRPDVAELLVLLQTELLVGVRLVNELEVAGAEHLVVP